MAIDCTECIAFHNEARMSCPCDGDESKCPLADEDDDYLRSEVLNDERQN